MIVGRKNTLTKSTPLIVIKSEQIEQRWIHVYLPYDSIMPSAHGRVEYYERRQLTLVDKFGRRRR